MGKILNAIGKYLIRIERSDRLLELSIIPESECKPDGGSYGSPETDRYFKSQNT